MYRFTPPTTTFPAGPEGSFWGRFKNTRGLAFVLYDDGRVKTPEVAPSHSEDGVLQVWLGGHTYEITDEMAALITEAGYLSCLEAL